MWKEGDEMARQNVEESWWSDPRRMRLAIKLGNEFLADGVMLNAWKLAERFWVPAKQNVPKASWDLANLPNAIFDANLAEKFPDGSVYVKGTVDRNEWRFKKIEAGKKGGQAKASKTKKKKAKPSTAKQSLPKVGKSRQTLPSSSFSSSSSSSNSSLSFTTDQKKGSVETAKEIPPTREVWKAYRDAIQDRHGFQPPWNPKFGGQFKSLLKILSQADAPHVARFYVQHKDWIYVKSKHSVDFLLRDAHKLYGEWKTGKVTTTFQAKSEESQSANRDVARAYYERKHGGAA